MNQNVPIIGQKKPKAGVGTIGCLIRDLDENGEYDPESSPSCQTAAAG
jgi:hypothetical protein